jgi:ribosomal peptide maturation radical SAM protein 1
MKQLPVVSEQPVESAIIDPAQAIRVALVNMPWARPDTPSIQCRLLKAIAESYGHQVDVFYFNLECVAALGNEVYRKINGVSDERQTLLCEWTFSVAAFGPLGRETEYFNSHPQLEGFVKANEWSLDDLLRLQRETMPGLVDQWSAATDWSQYDVVGFSSTFEQQVASLALARRIKAAHPKVITLFGGANMDAGMGAAHMDAFPWIDAGVAGEADRNLPILLKRIATGQTLEGIPGVYYRKAAGGVGGGGDSPRVMTLDELPTPDYDDYFSALDRLGRDNVLGRHAIHLPVETARGCWWGAKHHCTFCGLNALGMTFRSKSPKNAIRDFENLASRYRQLRFQAVDNIIDMKYLDSVCEELSNSRRDYSIFYETKANLTREQIKTMRRGGIYWAQPGIESLSTHVLRLMRKGSSKLINLRFLKWAHYYGVKPSWNILMGFPGETIRDYEEQLALIPLLYHLPPPAAAGGLWLERFSPYFFDQSFPVHNVRPRRAYEFIYPDSLNLKEAAYFFDYEMDDTVGEEGRRPLFEAVEHWKELWKNEGSRPALGYLRGPDWLQIKDLRVPGALRQVSYEEWWAEGYEYCGETFRTADSVLGHLTEAGYSVSIQEVTDGLDQQCADGVMVEDAGSYFSLALPVNRRL